MHIAHIVHSYYPRIGGIERVVQYLAEEQAKLGHKVIVITSNINANNGPKEEILNDVKTVRLNSIKLLYNDLAIPLEKPSLNGADVVHVHSQNSLFNIILARYAKRMGKPIVMDFLALNYLQEHVNFLIRVFGGRYQKLIQRRAVELVDYAITLNERDQKILKEEYGLKSNVIPHGIHEEYLKKPKDEGLFRNKYGISSENIISYIGRVDPLKGIDILVKAIPIVSRELKDFIVIIAGKASNHYIKKLGNLIKRLDIEDKVKLLGYINEEEKISLLDSSKVLVFPTRHSGEAYPLVVNEAYARGVPIIATKVGALPYMIKHMKTGILIPPGDVLSLAKAVIRLLSDNYLLIRMKKEIQKIRKSILTWKEVCIKINNVYENIIEDRSKGII